MLEQELQETSQEQDEVIEETKPKEVKLTKKDFLGLFLSNVCDYLKRKKYDYKVAYRSWVDGENLVINYESRYSTYCDLAIFLMVEGKRINLFFKFKFGTFGYKLDYRLRALWRERKNGVRSRDDDYSVASKTVKDDKKSVYLFCFKDELEDSDDNKYEKRIVTCNLKNKNTVIGSAIRHVLDKKR